MSHSTPRYDPAAIADLQDRTEYELWLLEAVYKISNQRLAVEDVDELIYPPSGGPPTQTIYGIGSSVLGDWRPGFLNAGAPLIFVTAFKLFDMLLEWVLVENGSQPTHRFSEKIKALKFPQIIEARPWLRERLIALYEKLDPLRGTVIHDRHFTASNGDLQVSSSRDNLVGPVITITADALRNMALVSVSVLRYLEGAWPFDPFGEKRLRRALDELVDLHRLPKLAQLPPGFLNVRVYALDEDPIQWDIDRIRNDIAMNRPDQDVMFDLRLVLVSRDGESVSAYLLPSREIENSAPRKLRSELARFAVQPPRDLNAAAIATDLQNR
jgi:hypothetical protein